MRYPAIIVSGLLMLSLFASGVVLADDFKIGVLDFQAVFESYEGYDEAKKIFDKDIETWQGQKQQMIDELMEARENYEVQRLMMTPETQREKEAELAQMEGELYQFEQEKFSPSGEAARRNLELTEPILEKIREVVKTVSEEEDYDLVLDITGAVLYSRPDFSLDEKISAALKAKG